MKRIIIIVIAVIVVGSLIGWRLYNNKQEINKSKVVVDRSGIAVPVTVTEVVKKSISGKFTSSATLEPWTEADIVAAASGKLLSLTIDVGSVVGRGQTVGQVDTKLRELSLKQTNLQIEKLEKDVKRTRELYEGSAATETNVNDITFNYDNAKLQAEQISQQISDAAITTPTAGIVSARRMDPGEYVNPGSIVATVTDISRLKAVVYINEKDVYRLAPKQAATIRTALFPDIAYAAVVGFISPKGDENHNYRVEVNFDNPGLRLRAGTYVQVEFDLGADGEALQIPKSALPEGMKNPYVYVVQSKKAVQRKITLGRETGEFVEVLSGLQAGEAVVESGHINLSDGSVVEINNQ